MGVKISELTSMGTLAGTEKLAGVDTGTQYTTPADIKTYLLTYLQAVPTYITAQATPSRVTGSAPSALGQYRSYLRDAGARTYTETNGSPTTAPNSTDGYKLYNGNAYGAADTNNNPTKYTLYIGTGKTPSWEFYSGTGRAGLVSVDGNLGSGSEDVGCAFGYNPATGLAWVLKLRQGGGSSALGCDDAGSLITSPIYFDIKC